MSRTVVLVLAIALSAPAWASSPLLDALTRSPAVARQYSPIPGRLPEGMIVEARSGCCSHHGGVAGCDTATDHQACRDGSDSPTCLCGE